MDRGVGLVFEAERWERRQGERRKEEANEHTTMVGSKATPGSST